MAITAHAVMRYIERVQPCTEDEAIVALSSRAISLAVQFGAPYVRLGTGQRIVIEDGTIVTVLPASYHAGAMRKARENRRGK